MNWSSKWAEIKSDIGQEVPSFVEKLGKAIEAEVGCKPEELTGATSEMLGVKEVFHFQDGNKRRSIDVIIVGDLALDYDDDGWNVYHVPTGACFTKAVPIVHADLCAAKFNNECDCKGFEWATSYEPSELLAWMKKVQEQYETAWTMLRLLTPDNYQDKGDSAKRIIKEWCLSVPVK